MEVDRFLQGKNILLLAPAFFNYEVEIKKKMEQLGANVILYDERSIKKPLLRAILKVSYKIFTYHSKIYFNKIIKENANIVFDFILVIKCDMIPMSTLKVFRKKYPSAKMCLYLFDSIKHIPGIVEKLDFFDTVSTFDRFDAIEFKKLKFRPLFFADAYRFSNDIKKEYLYDLVFCGTIHSDRYKILKEIERQSKTHSCSYYGFYYLQAKFVFHFYKLIKTEFKGVKKNNFSFDKKSSIELSAIQGASKVVIDIQSPNQAGLTMRTIEMIGMNKKIITTNEDIINYDFYNPQNIFVIQRDCPVITRGFIESSYQKIPEAIIQRYYIESWIRDVLCI